MKGLFLFIFLSSIGVVFAAPESSSSCELQANHWYNGANLTKVFKKPMSHDECVEKGRELFNVSFTTGSKFIKVWSDKVTETTAVKKYKRVQIKYFEADGSITKTILKRKTSEKGPVIKRTYTIESGWRCWTEGECEEVK
jgi:hypothetical protein